MWPSAVCLRFIKPKLHEISFLTLQYWKLPCFISRSLLFFVLKVSSSENFPSAENQSKWPQICILSESRLDGLFILPLVHFILTGTLQPVPDWLDILRDLASQSTLFTPMDKYT